MASPAMSSSSDEFIGCICCLGNIGLCNLFATPSNKKEKYIDLLDNCFNIKVNRELKFICSACIRKLEDALNLKEQINRNLNMLLTVKDEEEYLDESILEEGDGCHSIESSSEDLNDDKENGKCIVSETTYICDVCKLGVRTRRELKVHVWRDHGISVDDDPKKFACHFCDNTYTSRKACYTHLRMKHGLKLINDQTPKHTKRERKKCPVCGRDFSQKQILNKHMWKEHGVEVQKRKALDCPLCSERVSYGAYFSDHLLAEHDIEEDVEELHFRTMDDFIMYKSTVQEETKYRYRKTTATKQTIEGLRSHYMCSQSGVYVYQGKGIRPAPERQIYKTGKACPAHMVVTEAVDCVKVIFHKTHVGHGACPYFEPRDCKRPKTDFDAGAVSLDSKMAAVARPDDSDSRMAWICDTCGMVLFEYVKFRHHVRTHSIFENLETLSKKDSSEENSC